MTIFRGALLAFSALPICLSVVVAAESADNPRAFPVKPVRVIAPFPAGGGTDAMARLVGEKLSESMGQTFIVDNRAGAGSTIGTAIAVKSTPDGYTILLTSNGVTVSRELYPELPYDPLKDLTPISLVASSPNVLVTNISLGATSVQDLVKLARSGGKNINYASGGIGGSAHLCAEYFLRATGIKVTHIAYKGTPPALTDLVAGNVHFMMAPIAPAIPIVSAGRVRALAVTSPKRTSMLPDLPTMVEAGLRDFEYATWYGLFAPTGTPKRIVEILNNGVRTALTRDEVVKRMRAQGLEASWSSVDQFSAYVKAEVAKWSPIVRAARQSN